jgi:hypothetical protein
MVKLSNADEINEHYQISIQLPYLDIRRFVFGDFKVGRVMHSGQLTVR